MNVHGNDCMIFADSDFDGDILLTTNEVAILDNIFGGVPITYEKKNATKHIIEDDKLYLSDLMAFSPKNRIHNQYVKHFICRTSTCRKKIRERFRRIQ